MWLLGDKFVAESVTVIEKYFGTKKIPARATRFESYIAESYDIKLFANSSGSNNRSILGRVRNTLAAAMNKHDKMPKYILIVLDDNLIDVVKYTKPGVSEIFGRSLKWLAAEVHEAITDRKEELPKKAKKYLFPQVFWVALPQHKNFDNNQLRFKFNNCMESVVGQHKEMKMLKIKRRWNYEDNSVNNLGQITPDGQLTYWAGVDEALQFWETGRKKFNLQEGNKPHKFVEKMHHKFKGTSRAQQNKYYWEKSPKASDRFLPKPPK